MAPKKSKKSKNDKSPAASTASTGLEKRLQKAVAAAERVLVKARGAVADAEKAAKKSKKHAKRARKAAGSTEAGGTAPTDIAGASDTQSGGSERDSGSEPSADTTTDHVTPGDGLPLPHPSDPDVPNEQWTVVRLKGLAKERGVAGYATMRKGQLIDALTVTP